MKLQLENYGYKYTVETEHNDVEPEEYLQLFKGLLITATWSEKTINNAIIVMSNEIEEQDA
jgi:hypothetical protein